MNAQNKIDGVGRLDGPSAGGSPLLGKLHHTWRLVLLGGPGVGKGTQGELLCKRLEICHISTGDLFRAAASARESTQSPAMAEAQEYIRRGDLVPDSTVWELVREREDHIRSPKGFLLDGFPRTLGQAEHLKLFMDNEQLSLSAVVDYELPEPEIIMRLSGRRICKNCGSVFHVTWRPPKTEGLCDDCGGPLYQREDDNHTSIAIRLEAYKHSTAPLIQFYKDLGLLTPIDAMGSSGDVFARTMLALQARA
jgi:adenylate kinase